MIHFQSVIFSQDLVVTMGCKPSTRTVHLLEAWRETDVAPLGDERGSWAQ
jgi:hypothetical protein